MLHPKSERGDGRYSQRDVLRAHIGSSEQWVSRQGNGSEQVRGQFHQSWTLKTWKQDGQFVCPRLGRGSLLQTDMQRVPIGWILRWEMPYKWGNRLICAWLSKQTGWNWAASWFHDEGTMISLKREGQGTVMTVKPSGVRHMSGRSTLYLWDPADAKFAVTLSPLTLPSSSTSAAEHKYTVSYSLWSDHTP